MNTTIMGDHSPTITVGNQFERFWGIWLHFAPNFIDRILKTFTQENAALPLISESLSGLLGRHQPKSAIIADLVLQSFGLSNSGDMKKGDAQCLPISRIQ